MTAAKKTRRNDSWADVGLVSGVVKVKYSSKRSWAFCPLKNLHLFAVSIDYIRLPEHVDRAFFFLPYSSTFFILEVIHTGCYQFFCLEKFSTQVIYKLFTKCSAVDSYCLQAGFFVDNYTKTIATSSFFWYHMCDLVMGRKKADIFLSTDCGQLVDSYTHHVFNLINRGVGNLNRLVSVLYILKKYIHNDWSDFTFRSLCLFQVSERWREVFCFFLPCGSFSEIKSRLRQRE